MYWKMILENLIPIVFTIVTPVLVILGKNALQAVAKKWHLDAALAYESKVESWVDMGMDAAEKASLKAVKSDQPPTAGEEKLKFVVDFVNSQLQTHDLPQKAGETLSKMVDAKLMARTAPVAVAAVVATAPAPKQLNG